MKKHGWAHTQLIKFEDQQLEESPMILVDKGPDLVDTERDAFRRDLEEQRTDKKKKNEGASKILKIKAVGKAEDQKERLARYGPI